MAPGQACSGTCSVSDATIPADRGVFLAETAPHAPGDLPVHLHPVLRRTALELSPTCAIQQYRGRRRRAWSWLEAHHEGRSTESTGGSRHGPRRHPRPARHATWTGHATGRSMALLSAADFMVVAPYNDQFHLVREVLDAETCGPPGVAGGHGGQVPGRGRCNSVVFFTMATSTGDDMPRGPEFLFSRNRLNVAVSRAQCLGLPCLHRGTAGTAGPGPWRTCA